LQHEFAADLTGEVTEKSVGTFVSSAAARGGEQKEGRGG